MLNVMQPHYLILAGVFVSSASIAQQPRTVVGDIPTKCPATVEVAADISANKGFKISPQQAVAAAEAAGLLKCNSKVQQQVLTDSENYYITKFGSSSLVVVNGTTGTVSAREQK